MFAMGNLKHLASYRAKISKRIEFGKTPIGKRIDAYFEGELTGDILSGKMEGVDYLTTRSDSTIEINVRAVVTTNDGALISVRISGYYYPKDGSIKDDRVRLLTSHEKYKWLCDKIIVGRGSFKPEKEGFNVDYFYEP